MTAAGEPGRSRVGDRAGSWVDVDASGEVARVVVHGDLDATTSDPIVATVVGAFDGLRQDRVEVDMTHAGFVDSTGLGSLVRLRVEAREHGATLTLVNLDPRLAKLLRLTGLDHDFVGNADPA